ncbi:3-hydroxyacyl-CoA dehydrogenase NAD-binding domain-containing protein [Streptomyces oceani]|uniref:3-hydroxyacyl-CoA dehydrogenase n=1 Tax=Streptomyces oceani TaxID=1075402 RepID=A0A1E7KG35_9ACTN|nr:3-hydroxyacyl-CoA dehydrogenase NAD-binding domain-containing protein [Streptomyces oceani]OEV02823.1 3-hydroxyacyl-CoA dehydrogenase [Streptomyces oceani]
MEDAVRGVAVVGAGTMGQGIAQVLVGAGHEVLWYDAEFAAVERAVQAVGKRLERLVEKGRLSEAERAAAVGRLTPARELVELADVRLVVEAIVERAEAKERLFAALEDIVAADCLLATNTSSLSVTAVAGGLRHPGRCLGLHFFNPAPLLPLVEVVSGFRTDPVVTERARGLVTSLGKTAVRCADTPGFLVNRVARPFYAEAFRAYEERAATPATLDAVLRESGGFRMGPFELTDLIGQDVNEAVTRSVWEAFFQDPKFTPSLAQCRLVQSGRLGRKSGHGWYDHGETAGPAGAAAASSIPDTVPSAPAPRSVTVRGDLGPAAVLPALMAEAGLPVRYSAACGSTSEVARHGAATHPGPPGAGSRGIAGRGDVGPGQVGAEETLPGGGVLELPGGAWLRLADGSVPESPYVHFDLALDYRQATRIALAPAEGVSEGALREAAGLFQALGKQVSVLGPLPGMIVARTVAMLADLAADAEGRQVATAEDIDTALRSGANYPRGPLEWAAELGVDWVVRVLRGLHAEYPNGRYAPSRFLTRRGTTGRADARR